MLPNRAERQMPQVERLLSQACPRPFLRMSSAGPGCHLCVLRNHPRPTPSSGLINSLEWLTDLRKKKLYLRGSHFIIKEYNSGTTRGTRGTRGEVCGKGQGGSTPRACHSSISSPTYLVVSERHTSGLLLMAASLGRND